MTSTPDPVEADARQRESRRDTFAALRRPNFRLWFLGRVVWQFGEQMLNVAVGWEIYERTGSAFALGLVGLVQVLPVILFALPAGAVADRFNRKGIIITVQIMLALSAVALATNSYYQASVEWFYFILFVTGVGGAFLSPAMSAYFPATIEPEYYHSAVTWGSSSWQLAAMAGPAAGGFLIAIFHSAWQVYALNVVGCMFFIVMLLFIKGRPIAMSREPVTWRSLLVGVSFIWRTKVILGAVTLDMFAVLFGGAVALLPVYAKDVLMVGPEGLGWMRAAPSLGAVAMSLYLASRPPFERSGKTLLIAVAGFGVATIIFGISTSFLLSLVMLVALGALDNISVVIRSTLMLTRVPDDMRGRISAVNSVFIGASNELGQFESGVAAALLGPVGAVVFGGVGTLAVVAATARWLPDIRKLGRLV
ncbi:MAG TPA: MFS transporter [Aggregatilineales bacterium]|jgi:MFS family permease|nr:MFS transporter [Aggregatilineales bacterium]